MQLEVNWSQRNCPVEFRYFFTHFLAEKTDPLISWPWMNEIWTYLFSSSLILLIKVVLSNGWFNVTVLLNRKLCWGNPISLDASLISNNFSLTFLKKMVRVSMTFFDTCQMRGVQSYRVIERFVRYEYCIDRCRQFACREIVHEIFIFDVFHHWFEELWKQFSYVSMTYHE